MKKLLIPAFIAVSMMANAEEVKLANFLTKTAIAGDARVLYNVTDTDGASTTPDYYTSRLRLNTTTKINDNFSYGMRLKFEDVIIGNTDKAVLTVDRAFMDYKMGAHSLRVGRMGSPIYVLSDMLIDTDVEGFAYSTKFNDTQVKAGFLLKNAATSTETADENSIIYVQGIQTIKLGTGNLLVEASAYSETKEKTSTAKDMTAFTAGAEYSLSLDGSVSMAKAKGQISMSDADDDNTGFTIGLTAGAKEIKAKGNWQGTVEYKSMDKNAFITVNGDTKLDRKVTKASFITYIAPSTNLELAYTMTDFNATATKDKNVLEASLNYSF